MQNFDREYFRELIKQEFGAKTPVIHEKSEKNSEEVTENSGGDLSQAVELLSNLRDALKPPELSTELFPSDLDVLNFDLNGNFRIRGVVSKGAQVFMALFVLPHYIIFPGLIGAAIFESFLLGGVVGAALWIWRVRLGSYISISFHKKKYACFSPGGGAWCEGFPEVTLSSSYEKNKWKTSLLIGGQTVIERESNEKLHRDLEELAKSLKWHFGSPIELAEGLYISP